MDERRFDELIASGHLQPDWRPSFVAVPRKQFIPETIWRCDKTRTGPNLVPLNQHEHPGQWRDLVDGDDFVITQVDDGNPPEVDAGEVITSSAGMPKVVAMMLKHLDVHGGERVLEIGTGTGWNAALLAHRLGADRVTSIEIDPEMATYARKALADAGYGAVRVITGNGALGHPPEAPYHRIIATVACAQVPYQWVAQTRRGGRIVTPSWALDYHGLLLALTVAEDGTATGHAVDHVSFMRLRHQRLDSRQDVFTSTGDEEGHVAVSETCLHPAEVADGDYALGAMIAIGVRVPRCEMDYLPSMERNSRNGTLRLVDHGSRSCARLYYDDDSGAPYAVHQFGPRRLWDEVEEAHAWWVEQGRPGADRWQFSVTPEGQRIDLVG